MPDGVPERSAIEIKPRRIALPSEHGSWGFLSEPIVAALAIGFSVPGLMIAIMTIGAFLARQPLRTLIIDRLGRKNNDLARVAIRFLVIFGLIALIGFAAAIFLVGAWPLAPFAVIMPLAAVQIYFDGSRKSRGLLPELLGAVSISSAAPAIMLAGGSTVFAAVSLWLIMIARLIPSIIYVRNRLRLEKGKPYSIQATAAVHVAAIITGVIFAYYGGISILVVAAFVILLGRAIAGLLPSRRKLRAMQIGISEITYGAITVLTIIVGHYAGI